MRFRRPSTPLKIAAYVVAIVATIGAFRVALHDEPAFTLDALPPAPTTTSTSTPTTTTTTTTPTVSVVVWPTPRPSAGVDHDRAADDEATTTTSTTVPEEPEYDGRDEWGNQRYVDPVTGELAYVLDGRRRPGRAGRLRGRAMGLLRPRRQLAHRRATLRTG